MFARRICTSTTEFLKRQMALPGFGEVALAVQEITLAIRKSLKKWWQKVRPQTEKLVTAFVWIQLDLLQVCHQ